MIAKPANQSVVTRRLAAIRPKLKVAMPSHAMVLAAGLGTRMAPLTDHLPKPLVEVAGKTMLDRVLDHLERAGVKVAVVNVHHKADQVRAHLGRHQGSPSIVISDESDALLETGGGVKRALKELGDQPFFVINSDVIWRDGLLNTLALLAERWDDTQMDALLLMVRTTLAVGYHGRGDYHMRPDGELVRPDERKLAPYVFGGVQILHPRLFEGVEDRRFGLRTLYDRAQLARRLYGLVHGGDWMHVGDVEAIAAAQAVLAE